MPRRVSLPGASELFRSTHAADDLVRNPGQISAEPAPVAAEPDAGPQRTDPSTGGGEGRRGGSGRVRHDEKITVYVSSDELMALERARLTLRAEHAMAVDRGRIVREAIAVALADLADRGADSELVRRLSPPSSATTP